MLKRIDAWIFDVYVTDRDIAVWIIDADGRAHFLRDQFAPAFFVGGDAHELRAVAQMLRYERAPVKLARAERTDLFLARDITVLQVEVFNPARFAMLFQRVARFKPNLTYYNCDIAVPQMYFLARGAFPLAFCHFVIDDENRISELVADDSPWTLDYALPPLKRMNIRMEGDAVNPNHGYRAPLEIVVEGATYALNGDDPRDLLENLRGLLLKHDPDVILSEWGDSFIIPRLLKLAQQFKIPLPFNRDSSRAPVVRAAQSYFSYGRIVYKASAQIFLGRWHIDAMNAFLLDDYALEVALEVARLTGIPVQRTVRTSTGSGISAMEIATALKRGVLVPWHKQEPEAWKSGLDLIRSDKGGLVYQPVVGLHTEVAEIDFASMYPSIMARFNVSPETVGCECCRGARVPEINYPICARRRGLVPETLEPLIAKRLEYKARVKQMPDGSEREIYRRRQSAHKWLLVTCFGYLGYKNARYGRIEAHEAVTAYGRECLLRAKEIAEARGFRVLHAIVDAMWIVRDHVIARSIPSENEEGDEAVSARRGDCFVARSFDSATLRSGCTPRNDVEQYDALLAEIQNATNIPIALEGVYRWVAFLPSRVDAQMSVANRYMGVFANGEIKMRGIEARRRDTPPFIRAAQIEMLNALADARSRQDYAARAPRVMEIAAAYVDALRAGKIAAQDLVITTRISRAPAEYTRNNLSALVAKDLTARGVTLTPGETIQYLILDQRAAAVHDRARARTQYRGDEAYDAEKYRELLLRAVATVLAPVNIEYERINEWIEENLGGKAELKLPKPRAVWLGPLFDFRGESPADLTAAPAVRQNKSGG